jgi:hypothetical protein
MEQAGARQQYLLGFGDIGIGNTAVNRAYRGAFFVIEKADALGAFVGCDVINIFGQRRPQLAVQFRRLATFVNCIVRASRQACAAINTFLSNHRRHFFTDLACAGAPLSHLDRHDSCYLPCTIMIFNFFTDLLKIAKDSYNDFVAA